MSKHQNYYHYVIKIGLNSKNIISVKNETRLILDNYIKEMHVFHLCPNMISFGGIQRFLNNAVTL